MIWAQKKAQNNSLEMTASPTLLNPTDIGTTILRQFRLKALPDLLSIVEEFDAEVGEEEYKETEIKATIPKRSQEGDEQQRQR